MGTVKAISIECQPQRNELYACGTINRKPTVNRMLKGFPVRLANVMSILGETKETRQAFGQMMKVKRCQGRNEQTNGKLFFNLFQASAKLNDQLLELETQARYVGGYSAFSSSSASSSKGAFENLSDEEYTALERGYD